MKVANKYAPSNLSEVIYPNIATQRRVEGFASGSFSGHVIFHGPNGTAKTTTARLLIEAIGGANAFVEDKEFGEVLKRDDLKQYMQTCCQVGRFSDGGKFFMLFNEFDNAKGDLHKFWSAMDDCSDDLMLVITTNNPISIHKSIRSRCTLIPLPGLTAEQVLTRAQFILNAEGLVLPDAQVLYYLKQQEKHQDLRTYMGVLDDLLHINAAGLKFPAWGKAVRTNFRVI